jgi:hypothetical protein
MDANSLAAQVGLLKAIKDYDLRRIISFHSRVSSAEYFSSDIHKVLGWIDKKHKPTGELKSDFVSGEMPTDKRRRKLSQLKDLQNNQRGLLTNARCLSEGVDVPSLDGVAFIDPRSSQIDIIQAVGRAIRLSKNKKAGTIVLPVFIGNSDDPEQTLEKSNFKPIWDVLNALKAHDDVLANELDQMRTGIGKRGSSVIRGGFNKIDIDIPLSVSKDFVSSFKTRLVENVTDSWEFWFNLMRQYSQEFGNCMIPALKKYQGYKLGSWVNSQRTNQANLSETRKAKLNSLKGWSWKARPTFLPFNEARNFARELGLKNVNEWKEFAKSDLRPANIPYIPERTYSNEWVSYADWLGSSNLRRKKSDLFLPFEDAREVVRKLNLKTSTNWVKYTKSKDFPKNIPKDPARSYADSGWSGYQDFLVEPSEKRSFGDAKALAQEVCKDLEINGMEQWVKLGQDGKLPFDLPTRPERYYAEEWVSWFDWFGKKNTRDKECLPFIEARAYVRSLNLKTQKEWNAYLKRKIKPDNIPYHPERAFKDKGWKGWKDWLKEP